MITIPAYDSSQRVICIGLGGETQAFVPIEGETSASISSERESIEVSVKFSNHASSIPGQMSGSLSVEAYDMGGDDATGQEALAFAYNNGRAVEVQEAAWDGTDPSSLTPLRQNTGYITSMERELARNEAGTFSIEIELQRRWEDVDAGNSLPESGQGPDSTQAQNFSRQASGYQSAVQTGE